MARFNEILVGRYNRFAQKFLSMKGSASAPTLNPDLSMVWSLFHGAENRYLEGWDKFGVSVNQAAVAANLSQFQIRNPVGSNVIGVVNLVDFVGAVSDNAALYYATLNTVDFPSVLGTTQGFDARGRVQSTCIISTRATGVAPPPGVRVRLKVTGESSSLGTTLLENNIASELALLPGSSIGVTGSTVNTSCFANIWWRERFLEDSERA